MQTRNSEVNDNPVEEHHAATNKCKPSGPQSFVPYFDSGMNEHDKDNKGIERKCNKNVNCWDSMTRLFHAEWVYSMKLRKKYINSDKKSFYIVKNEDLSTDINNEMMSISEYIGIEYNDILLESTSFTKNVEWVVDSCYISRNDNNVESDYFSKDRVKKRWISVLSYKDILMIESVCSVIIKSYNYDRISPDNIVSFYLGYLYFLFPIRGVNRSALYRVKSVEKNNLILSIKNPIARNIYSIMPLFLFTFFINIGIVLKRIYILFFDITNKYKS